MVALLPGQGAVTLSTDFLRGVATARHHSTESQAGGAVGAAAVLTAQLNKTVVCRQFALLRTSRIEQHYKPLTRTPTTSYLFLEERKLWRTRKATIIHVEACRHSSDRHSVPLKKHRLLRMTIKTWVWRIGLSILGTHRFVSWAEWSPLWKQEVNRNLSLT